jgi:hypothetical protein
MTNRWLGSGKTANAIGNDCESLTAKIRRAELFRSRRPRGTQNHFPAID